ncbi:unnamed protein product [Rotaria sordida]|uniref:non-specific serine/threonine protein kinase n=1 Tax=Rotaria sordida TaxID=392033 RepID=A0A814URV5_9BILA|nr:unnamed protein product [Rotaria sordida]
MWEYEKILGEGTFGNVVRVINTNTSEIAACKIIDMIKLRVIHKRHWCKGERGLINLHKLCVHENIIQFYDYKKKGSEYHLYLEYAAGGDLFNRIESENGIEENLAQHYFKQVISGMSYLHSLGMAHRDLKPENILIGYNEILKICDFGLAAMFYDETKKIKKLLNTYVGTTAYMAPEIFKKVPYDAERADVWSCAYIFIKFLPYLQQYFQSHQRPFTTILLYLAQTSTKLIPSDIL